MTTLTVEIDSTTINFISKKHKNINSYVFQLIQEDMLLDSINESKESGIHTLKSFDNLDN